MIRPAGLWYRPGHDAGRMRRAEGGGGDVATTVHGLYCNRIVARLSKILQDLTAVRCVAMILPPGPWYRPRNGARRLLRGFNPVLNLAYNIKSYAHILISKLSFSFNYLLFPKNAEVGTIYTHNI